MESPYTIAALADDSYQRFQNTFVLRVLECRSSPMRVTNTYRSENHALWNSEVGTSQGFDVFLNNLEPLS